VIHFHQVIGTSCHWRYWFSISCSE